MNEAKPTRSGLPWRRWNAILHRDIGYLAVGLTLLYAISGIAVNHLSDWNPNYRRVQEERAIEPIHSKQKAEALVAEALKKLKIADVPKSSVQPDEDTLVIFFDKLQYSIDLPSGKVLMEGTQPRPVFYALNMLHFNAPRRHWTYIADLFALSLAFLAISGLFILKGKNGITGRGAWLTSIGVILPIAYWFWWSTRG